MGTLDRPESFQPRQELVNLSDSRHWTKTEGSWDKGEFAGPYPTASSALDNARVYPSNFDLNAAAAANASKQKHGAGKIDTPSLDLDKSVVLAEQLAISTEGPRPRTDATDWSDVNKENCDAPDLLHSHQPPGSSLTYGSHRGHSVQGSFQPLDETTFIGQTSITRSETKDLPLCHLLISPPDTVKPLIRDDLSSFKNHIVVCANVGESLYRFLSTLRLAQIARDDLKTIVILTANPCETLATDNGVMDEMDEHEGDGSSDWTRAEDRGGTWSEMLSFPRVFWVAGNCRHQRDLVRAGILGASSIVVMSHSVKGVDRDEFADSTAIMAHHMIYQTLQERNLLGRQHIVVEILERSNIRFLNMRDLSMVRSYHGLHRQKNFLKGQDNINSSGFNVGPSRFWMTPIFASGQVLVTSLLDNVLFQAYSKTHILDLVKLCCGVRFKQAIELDQILGIDCSNICLIETPRRFVGKSFLDLFQAQSLIYGIIPLGLYRAPDRELNNALPFIFTNPLPGILLKDTDMIYVLKS